MNLTPRQWLAVTLFGLIVSALLAPVLARHLHNRNLLKGA